MNPRLSFRISNHTVVPQTPTAPLIGSPRTIEVDRHDGRVRRRGPALRGREARAAVVADAELSPESGETAERALDDLSEHGRLGGEHMRSSVQRATVQEYVHWPRVPVVAPPLLARRL